MPQSNEATILSRLCCGRDGCNRTFKSQRAKTTHIRAMHSRENYVSDVLSDTGSSENEARHGDEEYEEHGHNGNESEMSLPPSPAGGPAPAFNNDSDDLDDPEVPAIGLGRGTYAFHPHLNGRKCDAQGNFLPPGVAPDPRSAATPDDFLPFKDATQFLLADFLYHKDEMSAGDISYLMELWAFDMLKHNSFGPFANSKQLYAAIDAISKSDVRWRVMNVELEEDVPDDAPDWQRCSYQVVFRDPAECIEKAILDNPDFADQFDTAPYKHHVAGRRRYTNFFSGNFAWRHCDRIYADNPATEGALYVPVILGSDKTTVSVATGHVEYHPLYLSIGNIQNAARRAHRNAVIPIGFLAIPKPDRKDDKDPAFRTFKKKLFHKSLAMVLQSLKPAMTDPVVKRCPDGHYQRVIYDLGAYIADYPEQVLLSGIVQNWCPRCQSIPKDLDGKDQSRCTREWTDLLCETHQSRVLWNEFGIDDDVVPFTQDFPRADIHELISPDILHQLIKGTFKDHLVEWVGEYLEERYGANRAMAIMDEIDNRIAVAPACFKQWTGDDSKGLMKICSISVYLSAIADFVKPQVVQCLATFMDFCYIVRHSEVGDEDIDQLRQKLAEFHRLREIFRRAGVREDFSLPRQHSLCHYPHLIAEFGAPNGLCSSITESRHISAVKKPWRRSSRYKALGQMLLINQRLDTLAAARADFAERNMLPPLYAPPPTCIPDPIPEDSVQGEDEAGPVDGERVTGTVTLPIRPESVERYPCNLVELAHKINMPDLPLLTRRFLHYQLNPDAEGEIDKANYPEITATATFYAPSDNSGLQGMRRELIRSTPSWHGGPARCDCVFLVEDKDQPGMKGMTVGRARLFFRFKFEGQIYPCVLVDWFARVGRAPDPVTGMWKVQRDKTRGGKWVQSVEHLDSVLRAAHLLPVFGNGELPRNFTFHLSLDAFTHFYVNQYIDYHAHEIAF
ncbi:hypothetical protein K488DRAFT_81145 [Vararia minispora EC-137]|uniref:Uncharacterized protein n=1 Tax=Vararia minispora EC-137 TaxID=1314806 RepID=A0ACB8Q6Q5_9AGAM|nr:hypothetical protein K488DRAFT_81145 [Vararia minispora EC-137]